jgi:hypothetical protein
MTDPYPFWDSRHAAAQSQAIMALLNDWARDKLYYPQVKQRMAEIIAEGSHETVWRKNHDRAYAIAVAEFGEAA